MTTDQTRARIAVVLDDLATLLDEIDDGQRSLPTPCSEYDVAALTGHVVGWLENFAAGFASDDGTCPRSDVSDLEVPRADAPERVRAAAGVLDRALRDGADERPLVIAAQGGMPGDMALSMMLGEYVVHGWDLERATGSSWAPEEETVTAAHEFLQGMVTPEYRGPAGMFGEEVPVAADAPALDRLVGFAGRDPEWTSAQG
ncbi:TIGR03086 family metal-binding protein [Mobilicoccus caccae]|uniref:TIGR03086 family protein n=1 Tax=Mobilicoccus caccae TaxID=1859295 RepID=A0ABQ6IQK1_9MICO|nr:TIGR03086 family metal-binding protein [Mobilicoccus caccae]GMA39007.1 TIGR03086 family protein [Mobilicoccus caccae]